MLSRLPEPADVTIRLHGVEELSPAAPSPVQPEPEPACTAVAGVPISPLAACRRRLSGRRWHRIERIEYRERPYDVTVGFYDDGLAGEIFIDPVADHGRMTFKVGSDIEGEIDNQAELASRLLQYGVRPKDLALFCTPGTLLRAAIDVAERLETTREGLVPEQPLAAVRALTRAWTGRDAA